MDGKMTELLKKDKNDQEVIKMLQDEIENERRKSTADQGLIKKLQKMVEEKSKQAEEDQRRHTSLEG